MLEELQSLSDGNKKSVLIIGTVIVMIIIIGLWAAYFNSVIMGTAQQAAAEATSTNVAAAPIAVATAPVTAPTQASGPSLWQNIEDWFGSIVNSFGKPSQYTIQPQ